MAKNMSDRLNLHEALMRKSFDHAVIFTYTFNASFFEEYCLEEFESLNSNSNITVVIDQQQYDKNILGPASDRPKLANLRYLLHPITVSGVCHPKLFLFTSKNKGKLIIGSANFTRQGITSNAEMVACYDYVVNENETFKPIFQAAFAFILEVSRRWPSEALNSNISALSRDATWLNTEGDSVSGNSIELLNNLDTSIWDQIVSKVTSPCEIIYILSRYFDTTPELISRVDKDLQPGKIKIFTQNGTTTMTEQWLEHPLVKNKKAQILLCTYKDDEHYQPLHAKAMVIQARDQYYLGFGSANFTSSGMFNNAKKGNLEIFVLLHGLAKGDIEPDSICDPDKTAFVLKNASDLASSPRDDQDASRSSHEINLFEATVVEDSIRLRANVPATIPKDGLTATIVTASNTHKSLPLVLQHDDWYLIAVSESIIQQLGSASAIIRIEYRMADQKVFSSNTILITNLQDIQTGRSLRRERHIKDAEQSVIQFFTVLGELSSSSDEASLLTFLNYCDIPVINAARPPFLRGLRPVLNYEKGMRDLGERNLRILTNLHYASMDFCNRHYKKLQRHVEYGNIDGISNYMHISLAICSVIRMQIDRCIQGFESITKPVDNDEWAKYRSYINDYYQAIDGLVDYFCDKYLPSLLTVYKVDEIREQFYPDIITFDAFLFDMIHYQTVIKQLRNSILKLITPYGKIVTPPLYPRDVFYDNKWPQYVSNIVTKRVSKFEKIFSNT